MAADPVLDQGCSIAKRDTSQFDRMGVVRIKRGRWRSHRRFRMEILTPHSPDVCSTGLLCTYAHLIMSVRISLMQHPILLGLSDKPWCKGCSNVARGVFSTSWRLGRAPDRCGLEQDARPIDDSRRILTATDQTLQLGPILRAQLYRIFLLSHGCRTSRTAVCHSR